MGGKGSIRLHPKLGLNPRLTICTRCGKDGDDLILLGATNRKYKHDKCGLIFIGRPDKDYCPKCKEHLFGMELSDLGEIPEFEKMPGTCKECREKQEKLDADVQEMVDAGGVPFRCKDCGCAGAVKADSDLAKKVRKWAKENSKKVDARGEEVAGVEFSKLDCPQCGGKDDK